MPDSIRAALKHCGLMDVYHARPAYQQNDYNGTLRVPRAKLEATREKRLEQMLDELEGGKHTLNMVWKHDGNS